MNSDPSFPARRRRVSVWGLGAMAALALVLMTFAYLWYALLSPIGYQAPPGMPPVDETRTHRVFAYGTLRSRVLRWMVIGRAGDDQPATLPGYRRDGLDIAPAPGAETDGEVFEVSADELRRLDRYERLGIRYERVERTLADGTKAWVYRRLRAAGAGSSNAYQDGMGWDAVTPNFGSRPGSATMRMRRAA